MKRLKNSRALRASLLVPALLLLTSCKEKLPQDALSPEGKYAKLTDHLWNFVFAIAVAVFFLVQILVVVIVLKFRRKNDDEAPKQIHGNTKMEIGWTIAPAVVLAVVGVLTVKALFELDSRPAASKNPVHVQVIGHQWWWEFSYPREDSTVNAAKINCLSIETNCVRTANELVIPVGRPVDVDIQSKDVIHSFWVPKLAGKLDATSGHINHLTLQADKAGEYYGQCAEFCGMSHANMRFRVKALNATGYEAWWNNQKGGPVSGSDSTVMAGADLFKTKGCAGCHQIDGISKGAVGPNLTHFDSRGRFAGSLFENNSENLRRWLRNPPEEKPGSLMPNLNLTEEEISQLVAYLESLK